MPLMVDESGRPIYANGPSVSVFGVTPTVMNAVPDQTSASNALISTTAATVQVTAQAAAHNYIPERIKDEQAIQAGLDSETPRNVMLAGMAFVVLIFVLAHPRFLARVLASARKPKKQLRRSGSDKLPNSATPLHQARPKLPIGGGDLRQGWLLRPGQSLAQIEPLANNVFLKEKFDDPFVSTLGYQPTEIADGAADAPVATPPPHIVPLHHHLPFSSSLLFAPFSWLPGSFRSSVTLAELFIIVAYLVLVAFALIWRSDISPTTATKGYGYDFYRTGLVSLAHIPWAVGLGVRGNIVGLCVSKGHDKLKRLHKIVGRICFLAGTLHSVFYFHKFAVAGVTGKMVTKPFILAGLIAWVGLTVMAVTSIPQIRNKCYSLFKVCHIIGLASVLVGMCFHVKVAIPWCIAAASVYGVSILCSLTKTRLAHAELTVLPGSQTTLVTVPALRSGWRPGQHVRIRVPGLGLRHGFEGHPFTIASAPDGEGMVLMCKVAGDWTQKLYDFAASSPTFPGEKQNGETVHATIILEGPYGGLGNTMLPSFSGIVLASGGSGISHSLALAHDVVLRAHTGVIRARTVDLIWAVPTQEAAKPLMPTLIELVEDAKALEEKCLEGRKHRCDLPPPVALRVHIYITRCPVSSPILLLEPQPIPKQKASIDSFKSGFSDDTLVAREPLKRQTSDAEQMKRAYLQRNRSLNLSLHPRSAGASYYVPLSGIEVLAKRPDFDVAVNDIVDEVIDRANRERNDPSGVCVASCGPAGLVSAARDATRRVQGKKRRAVGGIDYEEEHFAY